jgi:U3 small nucleolar RNA-associated protein 14
VRKFEELELNKLTLEQAQKRQGELARMRVLLMRQEEKARRHAKIKSKAFRRSVRRDKAREAEKQVVAEPGTFEAAVERQKKLEFERAHLRATQKHTKGTKWLQQQMKNHGTSMEGTKEAIADAQRNAERLKNFINDGRQTEGDDSYAEGENDDVGEYGAGDDDAADEPTTGLMAMKFMKRGIERAAEASASRRVSARNATTTTIQRAAMTARSTVAARLAEPTAAPMMSWLRRATEC